MCESGGGGGHSSIHSTIPLVTLHVCVSVFTEAVCGVCDKGYQCCSPGDGAGGHFYIFFSSIEFLMISIFIT